MENRYLFHNHDDLNAMVVTMFKTLLMIQGTYDILITFGNCKFFKHVLYIDFKLLCLVVNGICFIAMRNSDIEFSYQII